jgi:glycosyltransferase involved in cell wall biosynthesis
MACGRPVLVTPQVGLAELIREERAGVVCEARGAALAEGCDRLQVDWNTLAKRARRLAELLFSKQSFLSAYQRLYRELIPTRSAPGNNAGGIFGGHKEPASLVPRPN